MDPNSRNIRESAEVSKAEVIKVFAYIPNIMDYVRFVSLFAAFYYSLSNYQYFLGLYLFSFGLDVADGAVARYLNQTSRFGAALDLLIDKFSTPGLFLALSHLYKEYTFVFTLLLILDVTSHYFHMYSTLLRGVTSHKIIDPRENFLLKLFYGNKKFFAWTCLGHEAFVVLLYLVAFNVGPIIENPLYPVLKNLGTDVAFLKFLTNPQVGVFQLVTALFAPSFISKSCVHIVQLKSAASAIVRHELKSNKAAKKEN